MKRVTVRITRNFSRNLEDIETFLREAESAAAFESLLDDLFDQVLPSLEQFPDLGTDFFHRQPSSREAAELTATLRERLGPETALRELVRGDYLILYARRADDLYPLAIKHHRQLSFHFPDQ
jgi:plasmid stabilization system protein ParE